MVLRRDAHGRLSGVRRENRPAVASPVTWVRIRASELLFPL